MKKKIGIIKLRILAAQATPAPPIGPSLGQKGLNIMEFCKSFNSQTKDFPINYLLPVTIFYYSDKTFFFIVKNPTITFLVKKKLNIEKIINNIEKKIYINISFLIELVKIKYIDFNSFNLYSCLKIVLGSIKSMGILVKYENFD